VEQIKYRKSLIDILQSNWYDYGALIYE